MSRSAYSLNHKDWLSVFSDILPSDHVLPYFLEGLYKNPVIWKRHISPSVLKRLRESFSFSLPEICNLLESEDGTTKFQMRFDDQLEVETVLIPFYKRFTICLSTQVGCAMNCSFCYTGTQGLKRNLEAGEIVTQYLKVYDWLLKKDPQAMKPNIVFMGQGEPLHNAKEVRKAIEVLSDPRLVGLGERQMTLSTVGFLPGIEELKDFPRINLALSMHSPFDSQRSELIPVNLRFPLKQVLDRLDDIPLKKRQFITYEYLLIKDFNMSSDHAEELKTLLSQRRAIINLIPFNPFPGSGWERPSSEEIESFRQQLVSRRLRVMLRMTKGNDILAACGQLKINRLARKYEYET